MTYSSVKHKRGTSTQWASATYVLKDGEIGIDKTLNKIKVGNGSALWAALPFINVLPSELTELAQDAVELAITAGTGITKTYDDTANTITLAVDSTIANKTYVDTAVSGLGSTAAASYVPLSIVGSADGVASLDPDGKVPDSEIPAEITRNTLAQTLTNKTIGLGTGITSIAQYDNISGFFGQSNIAIYQAGLDKGGRISISAQGVISVVNSGIGYVSGIVTTSGGTRLIISVGGNTLNGTLAEFNAALTDGDFATESYVTTAISNILDTAPETLNTLNELAAAINDDASFASTITTALGTKEPTLPSQTGNSGKFLTTDGTSKSWATVAQYTLPAQTSNSGKFLTTDGTVESWATIPVTSAATYSTLGTVYGLTSSTNAFIGQNAGKINTSTQNVAVGFDALKSNIAGFGVVAIGYSALPLATGNANTAVGNNSANALTTGVNGAYFGYGAGIATTTGDENTAIGMQALTTNIAGDQNVAVGASSLASSQGDGNIGIGRSAGSNLASGSNNIIIGTNNLFSGASVSNEITIGNSSNNRFRIPGLAIDWTTSAYGRATYASTSAPSGGADGDVWLVYTP